MMQQAKPTGILFDMDGLLLDTEDLAVRAWQAAADARQHPIPRPIMVETIGRDDTDTRAIILSHMGEDFPYDIIQQERRDLMQRWMEQQGIPEKPGARRTLRRLKAAGYPLALATSTTRDRALWRMDKLQWRGYFNAFAFGDEVARGKPAPDIFLLAARRMGADPAGCIVLEDSPGGLAAARSAGMRAFFVPDLKEPDPALRRTAHRIFPTLTAACDHILRLTEDNHGTNDQD